LPEVAQHDVQTFEVDLPAMLETKRGLLARSGVAIPGTVHSIACDFMSDFESRLTNDLVAKGFVPSDPVMFVWEGVMAYIDQDAIDRCLRFMASIGAAGSRLIFDFSAYANGPDWAPEMVRRAGFTSFDEVPFDELWRRHLPGEPAPNTQFLKLGIASK
jgi:methyltransferase (TIGR00027 family)